MQRRTLMGVAAAGVVLAAGVVVVRTVWGRQCAIGSAVDQHGRRPIFEPWSDEDIVENDWAAGFTSSAASPEVERAVGELLWFGYPTDDPEGVPRQIEPVSVGSQLLVADAEFMGMGLLLAGLDPETGEELWALELDQRITEQSVATQHRTVAVANTDGNDDDPADHSVAALDVRTGRRRWCHSFRSEGDELRLGHDDEGTVFITDSASRVEAVDVETGDTLWLVEPEPFQPITGDPGFRIEGNDDLLAIQGDFSAPVVVRDLTDRGAVVADIELTPDFADAEEPEDVLEAPTTVVLSDVSRELVLVNSLRRTPTAGDSVTCHADLVALDHDGNERWRVPRGAYSLDDQSRFYCSQYLDREIANAEGLTADDTRILDDIVLMHDATAGMIRALDPSDGTQLWQHPVSAAERFRLGQVEGDRFFLPLEGFGLQIIDIRTGRATTIALPAYAVFVAGPPDSRVLVVDHEATDKIVGTFALAT